MVSGSSLKVVGSCSTVGSSRSIRPSSSGVRREGGEEVRLSVSEFIVIVTEQCTTAQFEKDRRLGKWMVLKNHRVRASALYLPSFL